MITKMDKTKNNIGIIRNRINKETAATAKVLR